VIMTRERINVPMIVLSAIAGIRRYLRKPDLLAAASAFGFDAWNNTAGGRLIRQSR
jgi:hypothetical protein